MDPNTVRERLAKLHAELAAHQDDPAARQRFGEILPDLKRMVDQAPGGLNPSTNLCRAGWSAWRCSSRPTIRSWRRARVA